MLSRLSDEFGRYFFKLRARQAFGFSLFGNLMGLSRPTVNPIIKDLLYLSKMPSTSVFPFFIPHLKNDTALVVSCTDIPELADSQLLLESGTKNIRYHVLAMQDGSATVGSLDQIFDTLALMSEFADRDIPILVHCREGVGRSAMMTALHLATRYLLNDAKVKSEMDKETNPSLNSNSPTYIYDLYRLACHYVLAHRTCCQFEAPQRNTLALTVLKEVHQRITNGKPIASFRDDNYHFLQTLVQSAEFKQLQYYYYKEASRTTQQMIEQFTDSFLANQQGWYTNLVGLSAQNAGSDCKLKQLLEGMINALDRIMKLYPDAVFSNHNLYIQAKPSMFKSVLKKDVSDEEMAESAFGKGSNTARQLRFHS